MNTRPDPADPPDPPDPADPDHELQLGTYFSSRAGVKMTVVLNKLPQTSDEALACLSESCTLGKPLVDR